MEMVSSNHLSNKDLVHHPTETTIKNWLALEFQEVIQDGWSIFQTPRDIYVTSIWAYEKTNALVIYSK